MRIERPRLELTAGTGTRLSAEMVSRSVISSDRRSPARLIGSADRRSEPATRAISGSANYQLRLGNAKVGSATCPVTCHHRRRVTDLVRPIGIHAVGPLKSRGQRERERERRRAALLKEDPRSTVLPFVKRHLALHASRDLHNDWLLKSFVTMLDDCDIRMLGVVAHSDPPHPMILNNTFPSRCARTPTTSPAARQIGKLIKLARRVTSLGSHFTCAPALRTLLVL